MVRRVDRSSTLLRGCLIGDLEEGVERGEEEGSEGGEWDGRCLMSAEKEHMGEEGIE